MKKKPAFKPVTPKDMVYASHALLYGLHNNPRKCEVARPCPKCKVLHRCPATN